MSKRHREKILLGSAITLAGILFLATAAYAIIPNSLPSGTLSTIFHGGVAAVQVPKAITLDIPVETKANPVIPDSPTSAAPAKVPAKIVGKNKTSVKATQNTKPTSTTSADKKENTNSTDNNKIDERSISDKTHGNSNEHETISPNVQERDDQDGKNAKKPKEKNSNEGN